MRQDKRRQDKRTSTHTGQEEIRQSKRKEKEEKSDKRDSSSYHIRGTEWHPQRASDVL